jgi:hypothetical protein
MENKKNGAHTWARMKNGKIVSIETMDL